MRTLIYCLFSFIFGAVLTGVVGWRFYVGTVQIAELSRIRIHTQTLALIDEDKIEELTDVNCLAIARGLEYYENDLSKWLFAIDNASGPPEMTQEFLLYSKNLIENKKICHRA